MNGKISYGNHGIPVPRTEAERNASRTHGDIFVTHWSKEKIEKHLVETYGMHKLEASRPKKTEYVHGKGW